MKYCVISIASQSIIRWGDCSEDMISIQAHADEVVFAIDASPQSHRVVDSKLVAIDGNATNEVQE